MRFDDRLETILRQPGTTPAARAAMWAQAVDFCAQDRGQCDVNQRREAIARLETMRDLVPLARRIAVAGAIARAVIAPDLIRLFGCDVPAVAAPVLARCAVRDDDWARLIPELSPTSRALLRERRDLSPAVMRMLASFGTSDFGLPATVAQPQKETAKIDDMASDVGAASKSEATKRPTQISDLVARIEAFKRDRAIRPHTDPVVVPPAATFRFETDAEGFIVWVEGVSRGALIGMSVAVLASPGAAGVDGQAAGAFRKRSLFRNARLLVQGTSDAAGTWLMSAAPIFDIATGAFTSYRGTATKLLGSQAVPTSQSFSAQTGLSADSVRQLVHELRTPLNAIRGFGEMIAGQILGPVSLRYRERASKLVSDTSVLIDIIGDLEMAARLDSDDAVPKPDKAVASDSKLVTILQQVARDCEVTSAECDVHLRFLLPSANIIAYLDVADCAAIVAKLVSVLVASAKRGETITVTTISAEGQQRLFVPHIKVARPGSLAGISAETLLDPAYEGDPAPPLGLGFSLRLIANRARALDMRLEIDEQNFTLILPAEQDSASASKESS